MRYENALSMELVGAIYCKTVADEVNGKPSESKYFLIQYLSSSSDCCSRWYTLDE